MATSQYPEPLSPEVNRFVATLDDDAREYFEERAGIAEYEAGLSPEQAERFAMAQTRERFKLAPF